MPPRPMTDEEQNKNATLADGVFEATESTRFSGPRLGMLPSIADTTCLSSEESAPVNKPSLKPAEGIEPSVPRIPSLRPHHATGYQKVYHGLLRGWLVPVLIFCAVGLLIYSVRVAAVTGSSMEPALREGSRIVFDRLTVRFTGINRGDVIVFRNPKDAGITEVKRVVGLPGERVLIEGGTIAVTPPGGRLQEFPQGTLIGGSGGIGDFTIQLGPEEYFVLGDNRKKSTDSRDFGAVRPADIVGRVIYSF